jgi:nitrite reductase/ring-hydroxylating ferredoxin subunit
VTLEQHLTEAEFQVATQHLDALVQEFEALPLPDVQEKVFDLLQTVDAIHRAGLNRLIAFLRAYGHAELVERAAKDPIISTLLLLYDLVPADELTRAETALALVRPYIHEPETTSSVQPNSGGREVIPLIQAGQVAPRLIRQPVFKTVTRLAAVSAGMMKAFDVDGARILVANVEGEIYAVSNMCPGSMAPLDLGSFSPPIVVCPWHNEAYDIRTGKRVDGEDSPRLSVLPIALVDDSIQVAVNTVETVGNLG